MRSTTRPTTACCTLPQYMGFLISEPKSSTCTRLAEVTGISHHSANRFLHRENYQPKDMYDEAVKTLNPTGGTLSVDDSVLDKPYSYSVALVGHFWSGKHHRSVKGINLITLYYTDLSGLHMPVNYRIYDKSEGKKKTDDFREMLMLKDQHRHYVVYLPEEVHFERDDFSEIHDQHWQIEQYHRAIKQVCHIEHFQVRSEQPVRNHILAAILAFVYLQKMQMAREFMNIYQHQCELSKETVGAFVEGFAKGKEHLLPKFARAINA